MYIVAIAWIFVVLLMGASEAQAGSLLGGIMTFIFYGVVPLSIVLYLLATPQRWRARKARDAAELKAAASANTAVADSETHVITNNPANNITYNKPDDASDS